MKWLLILVLYASDAEKSVAAMKDTLKKLLKMSGDSKADKDAVKSECVEEKVTQVKGLVNVAQQFETQLNEALANKDAEEAQHAAEKLAIAEKKAGELAAEASSCIGEKAVHSGDTVLKVEYEGRGDDEEDPTAPKFIVMPQPRPPQVSPYQ